MIFDFTKRARDNSRTARHTLPVVKILFRCFSPDSPWLHSSVSLGFRSRLLFRTVSLVPRLHTSGATVLILKKKMLNFIHCMPSFPTCSSSNILHRVCSLYLRATDPVLDEKCQCPSSPHPHPPFTPFSLSPGVWLLNYEA